MEIKFRKYWFFCRWPHNRTNVKKILPVASVGRIKSQRKEEVLKTILVLISGIAPGAIWRSFYAMPRRPPNVYDPYGNRWRRKAILPTMQVLPRTIH